VSRAGFGLYLLFMCSWFLHLPARVSGLESLRADLLLVCLLAAIGLSLQTDPSQANGDSRIRRMLWALALYCAVTVPLVEWPGSVASTGFPQFFKAFVFYWFTTLFVTSDRRLKILLYVFVGCQTFRVLEPLYLHYTEGYWGSFASMANWESMDRLAGAPFDVVNPNGLAFIVLSVVPFLHYGTTGSKGGRLLYLLLLPALVQTLLLTGSRSGMLGLAAIGALVWIKSRYKVTMAAVLVGATIVVTPYLSADQADRYLSIFSPDTKNASSADERFTVVKADYAVAMRRPLFGHGLGTSREANANFGVHDQPSHNLYVEILQELGYCGLILYLGFIGSLIMAVRRSGQLLRETPSAPAVLRHLVPSLYVWLGMNLFFSWASFGLSGYEWYLTAGLADVTLRLTARSAAVPEQVQAAPAVPRWVPVAVRS
jgi:putative inorganic carbon (HCO3(-)) transporter